jgi:hypothetical protein
VVTADLDGLIREYQHVCAELAAASDGPTWSPIHAERCEQQAIRAAREIADLLAARTSAPALV